jgi:hypothetical protein
VGVPWVLGLLVCLGMIAAGALLLALQAGYFGRNCYFSRNALIRSA